MIFRFAEFAADTDAGSLTRSGAPIHLRRKSFQVLVILLRNRTRLVSKEEILASVWADVVVTDDVLVGVIGELRKALGDSSENPVFIRTMRGTGYRFVAAVQALESGEAGAPVAESLPEKGNVAPVGRQGSRLRRRVAWLIAATIFGLGGWFLLMGVGLVPGMRRRPPVPLREAAWWRFDEPNGGAVIDSSGHGNGGELRGSARRVRRGLSGAVDLDGVRGWVTGKPRNLPAAGQELTFTAWLQVNKTRNDFTNIFQYGNGLTRESHVHRSTLLTMLRPDGRWEAAAEGVRVPLVGGRIDDGRWHQIAVRYDGAGTNVARLYTDGEEEAEGKWSEGVRPRADEVWGIGQFPGVPATYFDGRISDARVYARGLNSHRINALYRCSSEQEGVHFRGGSYYFVPLYGAVVEAFADREGGPVNSLRNRGKDFAGGTFAERTHSCSLPWLESADVGQDVKISMDLLVPGDAAGHHTQGGPFIRSRLAAPGDGIMGGTSAGFWVALDSNGSVTVRRLNPQAVVAFAPVAKFDSKVFHHLEVVAVGESLQVKLDGGLVEFEQEGRMTRIVSVPPVWKGPPAMGANGGGAGIEFGAVDSRGLIGGQEARGIQIETARGLW